MVTTSKPLSEPDFQGRKQPLCQKEAIPMEHELIPYDESIHFWFREGNCVLSGRTYPFKEHIKAGEFTYISNKRIWLVSPARGWQLQTIATQLGFEVTIHRSDEQGGPDPVDHTTPPLRNQSHVLPFPPPDPSNNLTATELLAAAQQLIRQLQQLGTTMTTSRPAKKEQHNG